MKYTDDYGLENEVPYGIWRWCEDTFQKQVGLIEGLCRTAFLWAGFWIVMQLAVAYWWSKPVGFDKQPSDFVFSKRVR